MGEKFRFLHCADLHIGSAFTGLSRRIPELDGRLSRTPCLAWRNVVETAVREKADFVLVAGDCFDCDAPSLQGRLEFNEGLEFLNGAGIPVYIVSGNHDPWPQAWSEAVRLPENVTFFPPGEVKLLTFEKNGAAVATIGGVGHGSPNEPENLAVKTGEALRDSPGVRIALVHANLCGDRRAAPAALAELTALPVDYWALGHVHNRRILHEKPFVVYPGCVQGRDVCEAGVQGCYVVDYDGFGALSVSFRPASVLDFEVVELDAGREESLDGISARLAETVRKIKPEERELLFRLKLSGTTVLDRELRRWNGDELRGFFESAVKRAVPGCYLEEMFVLTRMPADEESPLLPSDELERAVVELAGEGTLEKLYDEMRNCRRELPPVPAERFEELRREGMALLAELLTGKLELGG